MEYLTIELPVSVWQRVDACVDNSMAVDAVEAIVESTINGSCVRDAGWRASASYSGALDDYGWPPSDYLLPITLRREHWEWAQAQLARWEPYEMDGVVAAVRIVIADAIQVL